MLSLKKLKLLTTNYSLLIFGGIFISLFFAIVIGHFSTPVLAAIDVPAVTGLSTNSLADTAVNIINAFLGLVGVIALGIFVYGGYLWMFSGGDPKKIDKAKKVLISATIGLIIILLSWAIVQFIFNALDGGGGGPPGGGGGPGPLPEPSYVFKVTDYSPKGPDIPICRAIQATFDREYQEASISDNLHLMRYCTDDAQCGGVSLGNCDRIFAAFAGNKFCASDIAGVFNYNDLNTVGFKPTGELEKMTDYKVLIDGGASGVQSGSGADCIGTNDICKHWDFKTGDFSDKVPPQVLKVSPADGADNVCLIKSIAAQFNEEMYKPSLTKAGAFSTVPTHDFSPSAPSFTVMRESPKSPYAANTDYYPLLNADTIMDACFNKLDGNKNATAEGAPTDNYPTTDAGVPVGITSTWQFKTGETTQCVPKINDISPANSYYENPDNVLTITGENFDDIADTIIFAQNIPVSVGALVCFDGAFTQTNQACFTDSPDPDQWSDTNIVIKTSAGGLDSNGAITGPVKVKVGQFQCTGPTTYCKDGANKGLVCANDSDCAGFLCGDTGSCDGGANAGIGCDSNLECSGAVSNSFELTIKSPHINSISPSTGPPGTWITISGTQFGTTPGTVRVKNPFTDIWKDVTLPCANSWNDNYIIIEIPTDFPIIGIVNIQVIASTDNRHSNINGEFTLNNNPLGSGICALSLSCGEIGTQFNISGKRFGAVKEKVILKNNNSSAVPLETEADITAAVWGDESITGVKVPVGFADGNYSVFVRMAGPPISNSNGLPFNKPCPGTPCDADTTLLGCQEDINICPTLGPTYSCNTTTCMCENNPLPKVVEQNSCLIGTQSPSPYKGQTDACINAGIAAKFDKDMDDATVSRANIQVDVCGNDDCSIITSPNIDKTLWGFLFGAWDGLKEGFALQPALTLSPNTAYRVTLKQAIQSATGYQLDGNGNGVPEGSPVDDYSWIFKTSNDSCEVKSIATSPINMSIAVGSSKPISAIPQAENCNPLDALSYDWQWSSTIPAVAGVSTDDVMPAAGKKDPQQSVNGAADGSTVVTASISTEPLVSAGTSNVTVTVGGGGAAVCGNGAAEGGETCDDGNTINGDGCSSVCALEAATACNNNDAKDLAGEFCDDTDSDGIDLDGKTCANLGFSGGTLACAACGFDTAGCTGAGGVTICGNGKIEGVEQCDDKNVFANDGCSATCQKETPAIFSVKPVNGAVNVCKNAAVEITFTGLMDFSTITPTNIRLLQGVVPVAGSIQVRYIDSDSNGAMDQTLAIIYPSSVFADSTTYSVEVLGGLSGVKSKYGAELAATSCGAAMVFNIISDGADRCISSFTTGTEICKIDKVTITLRKDFNPDPVKYDPQNYSGPDLFTCAGKDDCPDDFAPLTNKNQHNAIAQSFDANGQELSGITYSWTKSTDAPFTLVAPGVTDIMVQSDPKSGIGALTVKADGGAAGIMSASTNVTVAPCDNPWPGTDYPFRDIGANPTNFSLWYCRDAGAAGTADDLPALNIISKVGAGEMLKEFFFYDDANPNDALGLRVYQNYDSAISNKQYPWSAREWYEKRAPNKQGAPSSTTVDGWEGVQAGRSIYVNAANHLDVNKPKTHIYLMSHSDKISANLQNIYGQLKSNWKFAIGEYDDGTDGTSLNPPADRGHLRKLQRDTKRLSDLYDAAVDLYQSKISKGKYPPLPSGSYIGGNSTSVWPSWDGALSNEVGAPMPHDPISQMSSLIGWWKLDDDSGDLATDDSPRGTDGELKPDFGNGNAPVWRKGAACKFGSCLEFDGTDDYVDLGSFSGLYSNKLTISAWIKTKENIPINPDNPTTNEGWDDIVAGGCGNFVFAVGSGGKLTLQPQCGLNSGGPKGSVSGVKSLDDDKWHHVAATYDGLVMKLYADGVFEKSGSAIGSFVTTPSGNNSGKLFVGYTDPLVGSPEYFDGSIDEVRIWNTPLSDTEINNLFKSNAAKFGSSEDSGWDQTENAFSCQAGADFDTHIYHYQNEPGDKNFSLYAALEWVGGDNSTWRHKTVVADAYKPCSNPSSCPCYNYRQREVDAANLGLCGNGQWDSSLGEICDGSVTTGLTGIEGRICASGVCSNDATKSCTDNLQCPGGVCTPGAPSCDPSCQPFCPSAAVVKAVCGNGTIESPVENCECSDFNNKATCGTAKGLMSEYYCLEQNDDDDLSNNAINNGEINDRFLDTASCSPVNCNLACAAGNPVRAEVNNAIYEPWVEQCEPKRGYCSNSSSSCTQDSDCGGGNYCIALGNGGYYCDNGGAIQCNNGTRGCPTGNTLTSCIGGAVEWNECGGDNLPPRPYNYLDNNQDGAITDLYGWCFR